MDIETIMGKVCKQCHYSYIAGKQQEMDWRCATCSIQRDLHRLVGESELKATKEALSSARKASESMERRHGL